jgi:hypothetical protein
MPKKSHHVVPGPDGGWSVRKGGASRASKHFENQSEAVDWARKVSKSEGGEVAIHRRDGTIREKDSYGRDPQHPREKR